MSSDLIVKKVRFRPVRDPYLYRQIIEPQQGGKLSQSENGYVYLKTDLDLIDRLKYLVRAMPELPQGLSINEDPLGTHISVIYETEWKKSTLVRECGKRFQIFLQDMCVVQTPDRIYLTIVAQCEALEKVRMDYGLQASMVFRELHILPFHLTVAFT